MNASDVLIETSRSDWVYTIASRIAYPNRPCVGFVGDGGFSMLMAEFVTRGTPDRRKVLETILGNKVRELL
jgi:thiamine pyrophosphate-dependent acetolactate synthase large subunit-like protein